MFESLSEKLGGILDRLTRRGALSEADVDAALREVRRALLDADVALDVVREFSDQVRQHAVGVEVVKSVTPGQLVVKIVHDQLIATLGARAEPIDLNAPAPVAIMMVGLQGSGKTTTTAKLAKRLTEQSKQKVLMASLDVRRPAAMEQLAVLGRQVGVETLPIVEGQQPTQIAQRALQAGRLGSYDVVLLDTAGRTTLDDAMMEEAAAVKRTAGPHEVLLVADSLTGQDAVNLARAFNERVGLTGIVLTRIDGDGRGGAALSMRAVTGKPIKLMGTGEKLDALEDFHPARIADRILGMGDIVSLVEKAAATIDAEKAARVAERMRKGAFDLTDLREQLLQMQQMGGMSGLMGMLPGVAKMKNQLASANLDERLLKRQVAAINSMTRAGAPASRHPQGQPQEAHRGRLRHQGRGHQPHAQDASHHGGRHEGDGRRQARADGGNRQHAGAGLRHAEPRADGQARGKNARRLAARRPAAQRAAPRRPSARHAGPAAQISGQPARPRRPQAARSRRLSGPGEEAMTANKGILCFVARMKARSAAIRDAVSPDCGAARLHPGCQYQSNREEPECL